MVTIDDTIKMYDTACREYILKTCSVDKEFLDTAFPLKSVTSAGIGVDNERFTIETALEHYVLKNFCKEARLKILTICRKLKIYGDEPTIIITWKAIYNKFIKQIKPNKTSEQSTEASLEQIGKLFEKVCKLNEEERNHRIHWADY